MERKAPANPRSHHPARALVLAATALTLAAPALQAQPGPPGQSGPPGQANKPSGPGSGSLTITPDTVLRFGAFVVITSGSRTVSASGTVTNTSVFPVGSSPVGPAQFTVTYDRGNNNQKPLDVVFEVILAGVSPVNQAGVTGRLSGFDSDLTGAAVLVPGQAYRYTIPNCVTRTCSKSFRVGARLDVTRSSGGGDLTIPLPMVANIISVDKL
jgi:hypothetical protein